MDGKSEREARFQSGIQAFLSADYNGCVELLGPLLQYFATSEMPLLMMISLQRIGASDALRRFVHQTLQATADKPEIQLTIKLVLGIEPADPALACATNALQRAQLHYYVSAYYTSIGQTEQATRHLEICAGAPGDFLEKRLADAELQQHAWTLLDDDAWAREIAGEAAILVLSLKARNIDRATRAAERAVGLLGQRPEAFHLTLEPALDALGDFFAQTRQWRSACEVMQRHLKVIRARSGRADEVMHRLRNLAVMLQNLGRLAEAEALFREALQAAEIAEPHGGLYQAEILNRLGFLCADRGRPQEAEAHYRQAQRAVEHAAGKDHAEYAQTLKNLGELYRQTGQWPEAIASFFYPSAFEPRDSFRHRRKHDRSLCRLRRRFR
jgi:tetratricopeptide (TPR) repeat protein